MRRRRGEGGEDEDVEGGRRMRTWRGEGGRVGRIHGCSAWMRGLGSQDVQVCLAADTMNTRLVFHSFSAW